MAQFPYFGSFDFKTLTLSGPVTENNKTKVKVLNADGKVPYFNMAQYTGTPLRAKFAMDAPSADGDPDRRTQTVSVGDGDLLAAVRRFDAFVCKYAVENSDKIFGKKMNLEQIEQRYERMEKTNDKFPGSYFKMKVKVGSSEVPTNCSRGGQALRRRRLGAACRSVGAGGVGVLAVAHRFDPADLDHRKGGRCALRSADPGGERLRLGRHEA